MKSVVKDNLKATVGHPEGIQPGHPEGNPFGFSFYRVWLSRGKMARLLRKPGSGHSVLTPADCHGCRKIHLKRPIFVWHPRNDGRRGGGS